MTEEPFFLLLMVDSEFGKSYGFNVVGYRLLTLLEYTACVPSVRYFRLNSRAKQNPRSCDATRRDHDRAPSNELNECLARNDPMMPIDSLVPTSNHCFVRRKRRGQHITKQHLANRLEAASSDLYHRHQ
jgi:hypothetical protein